jgi:inner membrane protein
MPFLEQLTAPWWWLVAGAILLILEVVLPGVFLLWLGVAALLVGALLWVMPLAFVMQFVVFGALAALLVIFARVFLRYGVSVSDRSAMNLRGHRYVGQTVVVAEAIRDGRGKVHVGDTQWVALGSDAVAGSRVKVTAVEGTQLRVEPV